MHKLFYFPEPALSAFSTATSSVTLGPSETSVVTVNFLPFQTGKRQCSIIFINEEVGEFLYSIDATATLPLPQMVPFKQSEHSVRVSSAAAAGEDKVLLPFILHLLHMYVPQGHFFP